MDIEGVEGKKCNVSQCIVLLPKIMPTSYAADLPHAFFDLLKETPLFELTAFVDEGLHLLE